MGSNLSDHFPISFSFFNDNSIEYLNESDDNLEFVCSFDWKNATNIELNNYKLILDELLKDIYLPYDVINCKNFLCSDYTSFITENLDSIIDIIVLSASLTIPRVKKFNNKKRAGWNKYVKYFKDRSIFWNRLWIQAGRPQTGNLFSARKEARKNYHESIKFILKNKDRII